MAKEVTRYMKREVERELWARAAGRCQFDGCNRPVFKSPVTQEQVNISEKAHIYSFSEIGPRGWGPFVTNRKQLNEVANLMLVCHDCHNTIDQDKEGERYSAELLIKWKDEHENRIAIVTGVDPVRPWSVVWSLGRRWKGHEVSRDRGPIPETRYAKAGDGVHIAYQVTGAGPLDVVMVPGFVSHV